LSIRRQLHLVVDVVVDVVVACISVYGLKLLQFYGMIVGYGDRRKKRGWIYMVWVGVLRKIKSVSINETHRHDLTLSYLILPYLTLPYLCVSLLVEGLDDW
jgi:hypothetical protein